MISTPLYSQVESSIKKIQKLSDRDIVLIVGPTGSGKSTFLNMMARSKLTCKKNQYDDWQIHADPQVAAIGGIVSCTFLPNYWLDESLNIIYCDCPGFMDSRGYEYDIAKSHFLHVIGNCCKSIKVVAILDWHTLKGGKGAMFIDTIKQMDILIENFNFSTDCIFITSKIPATTSRFNVKKYMNDKLQIDFPENKIFLIKQPDINGNLTLLDHSVINQAPSLNQKCRLPLSEENKLKLEQFTTVVKNQIESRVSYMKLLLQFALYFYYQNNLNAALHEIQQFQSFYKSSYQNIQNSASFTVFESNVTRFCSQLESKNCAKYSGLIMKLLSSIKVPILQQAFLFNLLTWKEDFTKYSKLITTTSLNSKKKGQNITLVDLYTLSSFLQNLTIDVNNVKPSVHKKLTQKPPQINVQIKGLTKYTGSVRCSGQAPYSGTKPYSGTVKYEVEQYYSGSVKYKVYVPYSGSVSTPHCSHSKGIINSPCWLCDHHTQHVSYSGNHQLSGYIQYSGKAKDNCISNYSGYVGFGGKAKYTKDVSYEGSVPYSLSKNVACQKDHHSCLCNELANLCFNGNRLSANLDYFYFILEKQNQQLSKFNQSLSSINFKSKSYNASVLQQFKIYENLSQVQVKQQIHLLLTQDKQKFVYGYQGKVAYSGSKNYSGKQKYSGTAQYSGQVECKGFIPYSGQASKYVSKTIYHSVRLSSCYQACWACNGYRRYWTHDAEVNISKNVKEQYKGNVNYCIKKAYDGSVNYSGELQYHGQARYNGDADYKGNHEIQCNKDHHNCKSCDKWVQYVNLLKAIYEDIENIKSVILQNGKKLENLYLNDFKKRLPDKK